MKDWVRKWQGRCSLERVVKKSLRHSVTRRTFNWERRDKGNSILGRVNSLCKRAEVRKNSACLGKPTWLQHGGWREGHEMRLVRTPEPDPTGLF